MKKIPLPIILITIWILNILAWKFNISIADLIMYFNTDRYEMCSNQKILTCDVIINFDNSFFHIFLFILIIIYFIKKLITKNHATNNSK